MGQGIVLGRSIGGVVLESMDLWNPRQPAEFPKVPGKHSPAAQRLYMLPEQRARTGPQSFLAGIST